MFFVFLWSLLGLMVFFEGSYNKEVLKKMHIPICDHHIFTCICFYYKLRNVHIAFYINIRI